MCREEVESLEHPILECACLGDQTGVEICRALGLKEEDYKEISLTNLGLSLWKCGVTDRSDARKVWLIPKRNGDNCV